MKKRFGLISIILIMSMLLTGCGVEDRSEIEKAREEARVLEPTYNDDLEEISEIVRNKDLGDFTLVMKYDTIDYDLNNWNITDNKTIRMQAWTEGAPEDWDVIVEHVHVDLFIGHKSGDKPSILQDSMDDKYHGVKQDGFKISDSIKYDNIFGVIGATEELHRAIAATTDRNLKLKDLREIDFDIEGYTHNKMQVVYDVVVKKPDNDYYETIAVYDEIVIPTARFLRESDK